MAKPLVSILIPSYNHGKFLRPCLESIRAQTFEDWELVAVDDVSTDDSVRILRSAASKDARIRVLVNPTNLGTYGTEGLALQESSGQFVAVMNSDDLWDPQKLQEQVAALDRDPDASFCYTAGSMITTTGETTEGSVHGDFPVADPQEPLPYLLAENRILASSVVFRRERLRFETSCRYSGDWVALLEASLRGHARYIDQKATFWRQHDTNSFRRSIPQTLEEIRVRRAIHENAAAWSVRGIEATAIRQGLAKNAIHLVPLLIYLNASKDARYYASYALTNFSNKRTALVRAIASILPPDVARRRLWSPSDLAAAAGREAEFASMLAAIAPLRFETPVL